MKKFTKSLGASTNPPPAEEIVLAKLIQIASFKGLQSCRGDFFRRNNLRRVVACCVRGANQLDPERPLDTLNIDVIDSSMGNDTPDGCGQYSHYVPNYVAFTLGKAFEQALRPEEK